MGAFDDESQSTSRYSSMLGRGVGEARRRIVLICLIVFFFILTLVAFRRQDTIKEVVNKGMHRSSTAPLPTAPLPVATSHTKIEPEEEHIVKADTQKSEKTKSTPPTPPPTYKGPVLGKGERTLAQESLQDIHNSSLGFGKVFVLNVPARSDKLDAMKLSSSLTGFDFDIIEGINGKEVPKKALSGIWEDKPSVGGVIGCWRGHMEFAGEVARRQLATALIMEDDADWDVSFRSQLEFIALGSQTLLNTPKDKVPASPYGDGWDLIWLGHCASQPDDGDNRRFIMRNDPTVTPPNHRTNYGGIPDMTPYDNSTRLMYFSKGSTCTYSYALSLHGARKMLKWLSMDIYSGPIDFGLHDMCAKKERGFKCIGVFPQIIADHKPAGAGSKDTDIGNGDEKVREKGFSYNIVHSTRLNADVLTDGLMDKVTSQWPDDTPKLSGPIVTEFTNEAHENTPDKMA